MSNILSILERAKDAKRKQTVSAEDDARFLILIQKILADITSKPQIKGDKGNMPIKGVDYFTSQDIEEFLRLSTPVLGKDYFTSQEKTEMLQSITPVKGVHYFDGKKGKDGRSIKGDPGRDGLDGVANMDEVQSILQRGIISHEKEVDHSLIHASDVLGTKQVDESTIKDGTYLQYDGKSGKIVYSFMQKDTYVPPRRDWFPSDGVGLPNQTGNSGKFLTTDGTTSSWGTPSASGVNYADKEMPGGAVNGTNATFTLAHTPTAGSELFFVNGILQNVGAGNDYTIAIATITAATAPVTGSILLCSYRY